jgi:hypothetical protein
VTAIDELIEWLDAERARDYEIFRDWKSAKERHYYEGATDSWELAIQKACELRDKETAGE